MLGPCGQRKWGESLRATGDLASKVFRVVLQTSPKVLVSVPCLEAVWTRLGQFTSPTESTPAAALQLL